jgi:transposase
MANVLTVQQQQAIASLAAQGWSIRRIARELKIHRKTVRQYLPKEPEVSKCTTLSTAGSPSKCTISTAGKTGRKSLCEPFVKLIEEKLDQGLSAQRIYQDLQVEVQFAGSYQAVKRSVRALLQKDPERRVWRIEVAPGEEVQVDFGAGIPIVSADGRKKKVWIFRIVLSFSRKAYSEAVFHQDTETFLRCLENAFAILAGCPRPSTWTT